MSCVNSLEEDPNSSMVLKYVIETDESTHFIFSDGRMQYFQTTFYDDFEIEFDVTTATQSYFSLIGNNVKIYIYLNDVLIYQESCFDIYCKIEHTEGF